MTLSVPSWSVVSEIPQVDKSTFEGKNAVSSLELISRCMIINERELFFTWTALDSPESQPIQTGDSLIGDQVVLNITFPDSDIDPALNVVEVEMEFWDEEGGYEFSWSWGLGNQLIRETYDLGNRLLTIDIIGRTESEQEFTFEFNSLMLINHFYPNVTIVTPRTGDVVLGTFNISWDVVDRNSEDSFVRTDVRVVLESGGSYLIASSQLSLNRTWFEWDSTMYGPPSHPSRIAMVVVEVTDETGLSGIGNSGNFTLGILTDHTSPTIDSPDDVTGVEGQMPAAIYWQPRDDYPLRYHVYINDSRIIDEPWDGSDIEVSVLDFIEGVNLCRLVVFDQGGNSASDTIIITVLEKPFDTTPILFGLIGAGLTVMIILILFGLQEEFKELIGRESV